jgi:hypothetical protein
VDVDADGKVLVKPDGKEDDRPEGVGPGSRFAEATNEVGSERGNSVVYLGSNAASSIGGWTSGMIGDDDESGSSSCC